VNLDVRRLPQFKPTMRRFILVLVVFHAALLVGGAQTADGPRMAYPGRTLTGACDECRAGPSEIYLWLRDGACEPNDLAVFRVCTGEPLPVSLFVGRGAWHVASMMVRDYPDTPSDRIAILRSPDCAVDDPYPNIEAWVVPNGAAPPPYADGVRLSDVSVTDAWQGAVRNSAAFHRALPQAVAALRERTNTYVVVRGYYWRRPTPQMRSNLAWARSLAHRSGRGRVYVRLLPALNAFALDSDRVRDYPEISVVTIKATLVPDSKATPN
jgi:hypothetical protein